MRYIPHTDDEIRRMLDVIGKDSVDDLFEQIPDAIRQTGSLDLPPPLSEPELIDRLRELSENNDGANKACFAGWGSYNHHIPPIVDQILQRSEFATAYTPYQPEVSQGTLQAIFEFQTMVARLLEMDVANASLYDGASSLAEAVLMAARTTRKRTFLVSDGIHPDYLQVVRTYTKNLDFSFRSIPLGPDGRTELDDLAAGLGQEIAGVVVQSPNVFGVIEDLRHVGKIVGPSAAKTIVTFTEPLAYGLLAGPGRFGADIVCGEGQSFGIPAGFGGPYLGLFATTMDNVRNLPGRLCGQTVDAKGREGYVLTLATREQHIRREKATSNICTNQALCALAACVYMAILGARGLPKLARINLAKANYLKDRLTEKGVQIVHSAPTFNEFAYTVKADANDVLEALGESGILGGVPVSMIQGQPNGIVVCVTEKNSKQEMDDYVEIVKRFV